MAYPQYFGAERLTKEPSSYYAHDGPTFNPHSLYRVQRDDPYPYLHNDLYPARTGSQPKILSDTPALDELFLSSLTFNAGRPRENTAQPALSQPQLVSSPPEPGLLARSGPCPEQQSHFHRSAPAVSAARSTQTSSSAPESPSGAPFAPLKKSNSTRSSYSVPPSQDDGNISRQSSQHGSDQGGSPQSNYVPLFPEPQHYHHPSHANTAPPTYNFSGSTHDFSGPQRCYPEGNITKSFDGLDFGKPLSGGQRGPAMRVNLSRSGPGSNYPHQHTSISLMAKDIRPDMQSFEAMLHALQDFGVCKEIFDSMAKELDQLGTNARRGELENNITVETDALREASTEALQSAERLVNAYDGFAHALDKRLAEIGRSNHGGGALFPSEDIDTLSQEIILSTSALEHHVEKMHDRVRGLLSMIENFKDKRDRIEQRRRIWTWLQRALAFLSTALTAGACIAPLFGPYGIVAAALMAGTAPLCAALSKLCKKQADSLAEEKKLDNFLIFLREDLLTEAKAAEIKLTTFPPLQLVHKAALDARADTSRGWISCEEANRARVDWSEWFRRFDEEKLSKARPDGRREHFLRNGTVA